MGTTLICLILVMSGCPKTTDGELPYAIMYVQDGYLFPNSTAYNVLVIPDEDTRIKEFDEQTIHLEDIYIVHKRTLEWLFKQAARARELENP